jgi:hypothetical protein
MNHHAAANRTVQTAAQWRVAGPLSPTVAAAIDPIVMPSHAQRGRPVVGGDVREASVVRIGSLQRSRVWVNELVAVPPRVVGTTFL